jgi:hypothetical protein
MGGFYFPVSKDSVCPKIGTGFDLIAGVPVLTNAISAPGALQPMDISLGESKTSLVEDTASYTKAVAYQLSASGSGWGASVGMSLSESSFSSSSSAMVGLNFDAFQARQQALIDIQTPLSAFSADAQSLLKNDPNAFRLKYGDCFVAGYIYGKRCSLAYTMEFLSEEEKNDFAASLTASYSGADFSAEMSAAINTSASSTHSHLSVSVETHYAGFDASSPTTFDQIAAYIQAYDNAPIDPVPIKIIVMPWNYLQCVSDSAGLSQNQALKELGSMVSSLTFIVNGCQDFLQRQLFTGSHQLNSITGIEQQAEAELESINSLLSGYVRANVQVSESDVAKFAPVAGLLDQFSFHLSHFVVDYKVKLNPSYDVDCNSFLKDINGNSMSLLDGWFGGSIYFSWTASGDATLIARTINSGQLSSSILLLPDSAAGTIISFNDVPCTGNSGPFGQPCNADRSDPAKMRGSANSLGCDDPQNLIALNHWGPNLGRTVIASAI